MLKKIAIGVAVVVAAVLGFAMTKPDSFLVQRTMKIKAPPEKIFPLINDFHSWSSWSPWEKLDPAMRRTNSGAAMGQGAVYEWEGNAKVGKGRMEITEVSPPTKATTSLSSRWSPRVIPQASLG